MKVFKVVRKFLVKLFRAELDLILLVIGFVLSVLANTLFKIFSIYLYYTERLTPDEFFDIIIETMKLNNPELTKKILTRKMIKRLKRMYFWPEPI